MNLAVTPLLAANALAVLWLHRRRPSAQALAEFAGGGDDTSPRRRRSAV